LILFARLALEETTSLSTFYNLHFSVFST
jgi:hypothetical protein